MTAAALCTIFQSFWRKRINALRGIFNMLGDYEGKGASQKSKYTSKNNKTNSC